MRNSSIHIKEIVILAVILFGVQLAQADIYMKQKRHTDVVKIMGQSQPAEDVIEEVWITDKGFRSDNPKHSMIFVMDQHKMIMIDHEKKVYTEMPMNFSEMMPKKAQEDTEGMADLQNMMKAMIKMDATVQATGEKTTINNWKCSKYLMTLNTMMGTMTTEIWATEDLKVDENLYSKFASSMLAAMPGMQEAMSSVMNEMKKIKGVQVRSSSSQKIMNQTITTSTELLDFKTGSAPSVIFNLPSGYKKQSMERF